MSVNSKARINRDDSSIFEVCQVLKNLGYKFNFIEYKSSCIPNEKWNEMGYIVFEDDFFNIWSHRSSLEKYFTLSSVSDEKHFELLKEILSYVGGRVTLSDCDENYVHVPKTKTLSEDGIIRMTEFDKAYSVLKNKFSFSEIEKIVENKELISCLSWNAREENWRL